MISNCKHNFGSFLILPVNVTHELKLEKSTIDKIYLIAKATLSCVIAFLTLTSSIWIGKKLIYIKHSPLLIQVSQRTRDELITTLGRIKICSRMATRTLDKSHKDLAAVKINELINFETLIKENSAVRKTIVQNTLKSSQETHEILKKYGIAAMLDNHVVKLIAALESTMTSRSHFS